jgi:hypothetical protein
MEAVGCIISIQEQRFRLLTEDGQVYLLTLSPSAAVDDAELAELHRRRTQVTVDYQGQPNLAGGVVRKLRAGQRS